MADATIGERIASLEAEVSGFKAQILSDNAYIKGKLDAIVTALATKVGLEAYEREMGKFNARMRSIEVQPSTIIQQMVLGATMGIVVAIISYVVSHLP